MRKGLRATTLAAVSLLAIASAVPVLAENVTVTGITAGDGYQVSVPSVAATDTNLTEAQIRRLFTGDFASSASALADLDAGSVVIPEITVTYDIPKTSGEGTEKASITYRDIALTDVVDGVARSASVGSAEINGGAEITMSFGPMSTGTFDIGGLLAFYGMGAPAAEDIFKTLYADFAFEGGTMSGPGFSCNLGGAALAEFKARPLSIDFNEFARLAASADADESPSPEVVRKLIDFYVELLTAFESTPMTADGFDCSGSDKGNTVAASGGAIDIGGFRPGIYPSFAINDLAVEVTGTDAGGMSLGNFTWKEMDFTQPIAALKAAPAELTEAWFAANWRKLVPSIEGMSLSDLAMDVPDPENKSARIQASVGGFDVSLADYVNGLPSRIGVTTENIVFTVPDDAEGKMLRAMGITEIDLSQDLQLHWDQAAQTIVVDTLAIDGADLGTVKLSAVLGNATPELFSADNNVALVASMGLTLKQLTLDLDDRGLSALAIGAGAAAEGQDPAVLRVGIAGLAQAMVLGLIGTTPEAMAASEEIATFIKTKPQVSVTLTAKDAKGLALPLLMSASENPAVLAGQIDITATASGDARPVDVPMTLPAPADQPAEEPDCCAAPEAESAPAEGAAAPGDGVQSETQTGRQTLKN